MVHATREPDGTILLRAPSDVDEGGGFTGIAEAEWRVQPGGEAFGIPYEEWKARAPGQIDVEELRASLGR